VHKFIGSALLLLALFACASAQDATPAEAPADKATVYIYKMRHAKTLWRYAPAVYIDEKKAASLDGGRYFVAHLPPGTHTFRTKNKKDGGIELELQAGQTYYIQMTTSGGATVGNPRLSIVPKEEGSYTVRQMKPIKSGDVADKTVVDTVRVEN
jgi:hypothetical protein